MYLHEVIRENETICIRDHLELYYNSEKAGKVNKSNEVAISYTLRYILQVY